MNILIVKALILFNRIDLGFQVRSTKCTKPGNNQYVFTLLFRLPFSFIETVTIYSFLYLMLEKIRTFMTKLKYNRVPIFYIITFYMRGIHKQSYKRDN